MFKFTTIRRAFSASTYGKFILIALCAGLVVLAATVSGSLQSAKATSACTPLQYSSSITVSGGEAQMTVTNPNTTSGCTFHLGLASYKAFVAWNGSNSQQYIDGQQLFDSQLIQLAPGATQTLTVRLPNCNYQVDFFQGSRVPAIPDFGAPQNSDLQLFPYPSGWNQSFNLGYCTVPPPVTPPPPQTNPVSCSVNPTSAMVNTPVTFTAFGGNDSFSWTASDGNPTSNFGSTFRVSFSTPGTHIVNVNSDGQAAQCSVVITQPAPKAPVCTPSMQTVNENQSANLSVSGGNGQFNWSTDGTPSSGNDSSFNPSFSTPGTHDVTVTSDGLSDTCTVVVRQPRAVAPTCSPSTQNANIGDDVSFVAGAGNGTFTWTSNDGTQTNGDGSTFDTSFTTSGTHIVVVHSGGLTANCRVNVQRQIQNNLVCSPSNSNVQIGQNEQFTATGGSGSYTWNTNSGNPSFGNGSTFNTSFNFSGNQTVTVQSSDGESAQCNVNVQQQQVQNLSCSANTSGNLTPGTFVTFTAFGGNGSYNWNANTGNPSFGNGQTFSSQFFNQGFQNVQVTSGGQTASCGVTIQQNFFPQVPTCSASNQNPTINQQVTFYGSGGTGNFSWTANTGLPTYGYGSSFVTSFSNPGTQVVTMNSNGQTSQCTVNVQQPIASNIVCTPSTQNANVNDFVTFSVSGGNGNGQYFWNTTADGSPTSGSGTSFGTRFTTAGTKIVTVNSNGQTSQCVVQIGQVLGASTVDTGSDDGGAMAAGIGLIGAMGAYAAVFRKNALNFALRAIGRGR